MSTLERTLELAASRGVSVSELVVGREVDVVPQAPSHRWILVPMSDGTVTLGGMDRGRFAAYGKFADPEVAAQALATATADVAPPVLAHRPVKALVTATQGLLDQLRARVADGGELVPADLPVGAVLDHIGPSSGHVLHLFATPFEQRSLPPSDLNLTRTGYVLDAPLPEACRLARAEPWFGQPGGGLMVVLDRVIASYVDERVLAPFDPTGGDANLGGREG